MHATLRSAFATGVVTLASLSAPAAQAQIGCDRACLTGYVDTYFSALFANDPASVPLAGNAKITHNGREMALGATFWESADSTPYRWDIANIQLGDTGTEAVVLDADGTKTMLMVRLKVLNGAIAEVETIKANEGEADRLWGPDQLTEVSPNLLLTIPEAEQDSHYRLIAAAESYWRAFQTNGTPAYRRADVLPDSTRWENGFQTTGLIRNGEYVTTSSGFDQGRFIGRNIWDRRYPVVDTERGIVLSIVRFGLKDGMESQSIATSNPRLVGEFFAVKSGMISEIHAVLFNLPEAEPTGWEPEYGPPRGGAGW